MLSEILGCLSQFYLHFQCAFLVDNKSCEQKAELKCYSKSMTELETPDIFFDHWSLVTWPVDLCTVV